MTAALSLKEIKSCSRGVRCRLQAASTQIYRNHALQLVGK